MWVFDRMNFNSFVETVFKPRISAIIAALLTLASLGLYLNSYLILPNFSERKMLFMLSTERDDYGHISFVLSHLPKEPYTGVFAIGGSGMREALPSTLVFSRQMQMSLSNQVFFENLSAFGQSMSESLEIVSNIVRQGYAKKGSLFIIAINPRRFTESPKQAIVSCTVNRIPLIERTELKDFLNEQGYKVPWYPNLMRQTLALRNFIQGRTDPQYKKLMENLRQFNCGVSCMLDLLSHSPFHQPQYYFQFAYPDKSLPVSVKQSMKNQIETLRVPEFKQNFQFSQQILERLIVLVQKHHYKVILLDLPRSPESYAGYHAIENSYKKLITQLQAQGITYINMKDQRVFLTSNFYDLDHLRSASRPVIAKELIKIISQELAASTTNKTIRTKND